MKAVGGKGLRGKHLDLGLSRVWYRVDLKPNCTLGLPLWFQGSPNNASVVVGLG